MIDLLAAQEVLCRLGIDGWLVTDFGGRNAFAAEALGIPHGVHISRRFFYWIPARGEAVRLVHSIEPHVIQQLPGRRQTYASWEDLERQLAALLQGAQTIAMEHSPNGINPYLARLDAGTYQWLQQQGIAVCSSWPLLEPFVSKWSDSQLQQHRHAAATIIDAVHAVWEGIASGRLTSELAVQQSVQAHMKANGCTTDHPPICAINAHAAIPHYFPDATTNAPIKPDDLLLLDAWCKVDHPTAPYADLTHMAFFGTTPPEPILKAYAAVRDAQRAAIAAIRERLAKQQPVIGCDIDDCCRAVLCERGYGPLFFHRTGHNIHLQLHGNGPHLDNFESHDDRQLTPRTCCSIEPGVYLPGQFGIRLECNVFLTSDGQLEIDAPAPDELHCIYSS